MKRLDPILKLLLVGIVFFMAILLYIQKWFPNDGQTFQVVAGLLTGFSGAFLGFARKELGVEPDPPGTHSNKTTIIAEEKTQDPPA